MNNTIIENKSLSAEASLQILKEGNQRFINNISYNRNLLQMLQENMDEQKPFAAILSCMDSRGPAEMIFDLGIGEIFSVRIAGNVISENVIGSLEYAVEVAGTKLIVVLGHTNCGAIKGACDDVRMGNLTTLIEKIAPAIEEEKTVTENRTSKNADFVNKIAAINVHHSIDKILEQSEIIKSHCEGKDVMIVPAMYDIATGQVYFHEDKIVSKESFRFYL